MKFIHFVIILLFILSVSPVKAEDKLIPLPEFLTKISDSMDQNKIINYIIYRCVGAHIYENSRQNSIEDEKKSHMQNAAFYYDLLRKMSKNADQSEIKGMKEKQMNIVKQYLFQETRIHKDNPDAFHNFFTNDLATCFLFSQIINDVVNNNLGAS